jgi:hypothetical protein
MDLHGEVRRRAAGNRDLAEAAIAAIDAGGELRFTKAGFMINAPDGTVLGTHWSAGSGALRAFQRDLRKAGLLPETRTKKRAGTDTRRKSPQRLSQDPAFRGGPEVALVPAPALVRVVPREEEYPVLADPAPRPEVYAQATDLQVARVPAWLAPMWARLPAPLRAVDHRLLRVALDRAGGDPRRVTVDYDGGLVILNRPRAA